MEATTIRLGDKRGSVLARHRNVASPGGNVGKCHRAFMGYDCDHEECQ